MESSEHAPTNQSNDAWIRDKPLIPLSTLQREIWLDQALLPDVPHYNTGAYARIDGPVDVTVFRQALEIVVNRHDALRIVLVLDDELPKQRFEPNVSPVVTFVDFSMYADADACAREWIAQAAEKPFALLGSLLHRFALLKVADNLYYWLEQYHHIIVDGWTETFLVQEVADRYNDLLANRAISNPTIPSYVDFIQDERAYRTSDQFRADEAYWKGIYQAIPEPLLTRRHDVAPADVHRAYQAKMYLDAALCDEIRAFAVQHRVTLSQVFLAALYGYFARTGRRDDVAFGLFSKNRKKEFEQTAGLFVSTYSAWYRLNRNCNFFELLRGMSEEARRGAAHRRFPMSDLVRTIGLWAADRPRPFDVTVSFLFGRCAARFGSAPVELLTLSNGFHPHGLVIYVEDMNAPGPIHLLLDGNRTFFTKSELDRIPPRLEHFLAAAVRNPEERISRLPLLPSEELAHVLAISSGTRVTEQPNHCVHDWIAERAKTDPRAIAVEFGSVKLTYDELNSRTNRWAHQLQSLGVGPEVFVGSFLERSPEMIISMLAIWKSGGAYVPLDPETPPERLKSMLSRLRAPVVLTHEHLHEKLPLDEFMVIHVEDLDIGVTSVSPSNPEINVCAANAAYAIFTSGSTGTPKAVVVTHGNLWHLARRIVDLLAIESTDRILQFTAANWDTSFEEIVPCLISGACLVLRTPEMVDPFVFLRQCSEQHVSIVDLPTAFFHELVPILTSTTASFPESIRTVVIGGEAARANLVGEFQARLRHPVRLLNTYGLTETTAVSTFFEVGEPMTRVPVGFPLPNVRVYVLDEHHEMMPLNTEGELFIGGAGVAREYFGNAALTAERFVPDPHSSIPGARMYRTGDLAERREDGALYFKGRADQQVKIRGIRVELAEIEIALTKHPAVLESIVDMRRKVSDSNQLVAYVRLRSSVATSAADVLQFARASLPGYMIPEAIVFMDHWPRLATGKIDRRRLPDPEPITLVSKEIARSPLEKIVATAFADVLGVVEVGRHDDFFRLGGHSLLAMRLMSTLQSRLGFAPAMATVFRHSTVEALAAFLEDDSGKTHVLRPEPRHPRAPPFEGLSSLERRLWFLERLHPEARAYQAPQGIRVLGSLDLHLLRLSLHALAMRQEILRTTYIDREGEPVRCVSTTVDIPLRLVDLSAVSYKDTLIRQTIADELAVPFDLARGPLSRLVVLRLSTDEHLLLLNQHHIVSDEWSGGVLLREWSALYESMRNGEVSSLPPLAYQYAEFAHAERRAYEENHFAASRRYWKEQLRDVPRLVLPWLGPVAPPGLAKHVSMRIDAEMSQSIRAFARAQDVTVFMVWYAAFLVLFSRSSGQTDFALGSVAANRDIESSDNVLGLFTNRIVLRTDLSGDPTFLEIQRRARATAVHAYRHQALPFDVVVQDLNVARHSYEVPFYDVSLLLVTTLPEVTADSKWSAFFDVFPDATTTAKNASSIVLNEDAIGVSVHLTYDTARMKTHQAHELLEHARVVMADVLEHPMKRLSEIVILTSAEQTALRAGNADGFAYHHEVGIHELFEKQAQSQPDAIAIEFLGAHLSYRDLNARANGLAHRLRSVGVGPEVLVGLCVPRSLDMIVGILAILKSGGAYVPLDPAWPIERIAHIVEDVTMPVVLTLSTLENRLPANLLRIALDTQIDHEYPTDAPALDTAGSHAAYVLFTSGSTGKPKGVVVEHRQLVEYVFGMAERLGLEGSQRYGLVSTFAADLGNTAIFPALALGGTLRIVSEAASMNPTELAREFEDCPVDVLKIAPSHLTALLATNRPERLLPRKRLVLGGEPARWDLVATVHRLAPACTVTNHYGPTETTIGVLTLDVQPNIDRSHSIGPALGKPRRFVRAHVLDAHLEPVPMGVVGELYIGGLAVTRGYLHRPSLTAETFVPDPFSIDPGARLYRTGDLVRLNDEHDLEFLGRRDQQIKIRGYRVEAGEVEMALSTHTDVRACVVIAREDVSGDKRLIAYVVASNDAVYDDDLREHLRQTLPEYMIPSQFLFLTKIPLLPNGKVDQRALPVVDSPLVPTRTYSPARNALEECIVTLWEQLLNVKPIGIADNFFALGGHSLLAVRFLAQLENETGIALPVATLFDHSTVERLAVVMAGSSRHEQPSIRLPLTPRQEGEAPFTGLFSTERRLWFLHRLHPSAAAYQVPMVLRLRGEIDRQALQSSVEALCDRHEVLRTMYPESNGLPVRRVLSKFTPQVRFVDIAEMPGDTRESALQNIVREEVTAPFDLERQPPMRVLCIRESSDSHFVIWHLHHILTDERSNGTLMNEWVEIYDCSSRGKAWQLPPLPYQFADVARAENAVLANEAWAASRTFWKEKLAGLPRVSWPFIRSGVGSEPGPEGRLAARINEGTANRITALARSLGCTSFMAWVALFTALLSRYTQEVDLSIGTVVANRETPGTERLVGFFTNTLLLRVDLSDNPTVLEWFVRVRQTMVEAYRHQFIPFDLVIQDLDAQWRDRASSPVDVSMFEVSAPNRLPPSAWSVEGDARFQPILQNLTTAKDALGIALEQTEDGVFLRAYFDRNRVEQGTVERLLGHLQSLATDAAGSPEKRLSKLSYLSSAEISMFRHWNDTAAPYPQDDCMHTLVARQAAKTPDAIAIVHGDESYTYRDVDGRAEGLAQRLRSLGITADVPVILCLDHGADMITAMLGIWKAGGAYVPLDPALPDGRLQFVVEDTNAPVVVTRARFAARFYDRVASSLQFVCVDEPWPTSVDATDIPAAKDSPHQLAYIVYTSGSTGEPKGVMVEHQSLVAHVSGYVDFHRLSPRDRVLALTPLHFDASVEQILPALACGAAVVVADWDFDPQVFSEKLVALGVTRLDTTGAHWRALVDHWLEQPHIAENLRLHTMMVGGDVMPAEVLSRWRKTELSRRARLVNVYGPTESTVAATVYEVTDDFDGASPRIPIGKPYANRKVFVLDRHLQPVPIGIPGELFIGGIGPARGYLNQPAFTAERFWDVAAIPSLTATWPELGRGRVYQTGDLCQWRPDGALDFLGRADNQIKIRGYRVDLGEIEAQLRRFPNIEDAVVVVREKGLHRFLVAYVVVDPCPQSDIIPELANFLQQTLPEHTIPAHFVLADRIPRSSTTGKVDRAQLPDPVPIAAPDRSAPATETEMRLAKLYKQLLQVDDIAAQDDFFDLGGHSLLATQLISRAQRVFSVRLALSTAFQHRTVRALAGVIDTLSKQHASEPASIPRVDRDKPLPLSFGQERLWFLDRMDMGMAFHVPLSIRIEGALDVEALRWSLSEIVRRHESLRTTFVFLDDETRQTVQAQASFDLPLIDLRLLPADEVDAAVAEHAALEVRRPFDLTKDLLLRGTLLWLTDEPRPVYVLLATMHHIASDGWSLDILAAELESFYTSHRENIASSLPELPLQMPDVASWQRACLTPDFVAPLLAYWREHLEGAPLHLDWPWKRTGEPAGSRGTLSFVIDDPLTMALRGLSEQTNTTLFTVLLAVFQVLLGRITSHDDIVVGVPVHGRNREEFEKLIGFFVNNLPVRARFSDDPPFTDLLLRVRQTVHEAFEHADLPFEKIVECTSTVRDSTRHPVFQAVLAFHETPGRSISLPGLHITPLEVAPTRARLDLELHIEPRRSELEAHFYYDAGMLGDTDVQGLADRFLGLLRAVVANPETRIHALPLLLPQEHERLFAQWNDIATELRDDLCAHERIVAQARRTPDATAVLFDDGIASSSLEYCELISRANRLAHYLRNQGVGPEKRVGLCLKPSLDVIIGLMAILIAGGAYLPLDATYPKQRLEYMLADAQPDVIITHETWLEALPKASARFVCVDRDARAIAEMPDTAPIANVHLDNLAYVIYTSGSTGKPKGVLVAHRGLVNVYQAQRLQFKLVPGDRVLQWASLNFDSSLAEIWMALGAGATLCYGTREQVLPGKPLLDFLARHAISMVTLTPSALASLQRVELPQLHTLAVAGEACFSRIVTEWAPGRRLLNLYGPTEATIWATVMHCEDPTEATVIGRPIPNVQAYVLDRHSVPVAPGMPGELYLAGSGVARGYANCPGLTAERFLPNPFGPGRLYRTGDRVRWRAEGHLEFLGRVDRQVKLRGYRIELGEIEATLLGHPDVREAVVVMVPDDEIAGASLVAYVALHTVRENFAAKLGEFLRARLPEFMIPSFWMVLDALPRSHNGKVDRLALPNPTFTPSVDEQAFSPTETKLATIWSDVLAITSPGRTQSFFELGGHSLLVAKVAARIERAWNIELPLPVLFTHTTIAALAIWIDAQPRPENHWEELRAVPHDKPLPLSLVQERMWKLHDGSRYTLPLALLLSGPLDIDCLERTCREVVRRQKVFRTNIVEVEGRPMQIVRDAEMRIEITDLRDFTEERQSPILMDLLAKEATLTFDLTTDLLLRVHLICLAGKTKHALILNMHHITVDAAAMEVLLHELTALYNVYRAGLPSPLPELPIQYADFAVWQRARFPPARLEQQLAYWRKKLEHVPAALGTLIPEPRPALVSSGSQKASRRLPARMSEHLRRMTERLDATLFETMLAGFQVALAGLSGQNDIVVCTNRIHRAHLQLEKICGCFLHILPIRTNLGESATFDALVQQLRSVMLEALPHLAITAMRLESALFPERDLKKEPVFQISFNTTANLRAATNFTDIETSDLHIPGDEQAKYDLVVYVDDAGEAIEIRTLFRGELLPSETMNRLLDHLAHVLERVSDDPTQELGALGLRA